jgi:hypothetical protein
VSISSSVGGGCRRRSSFGWSRGPKRVTAAT